ncbi:MAG: DUF1780 domain-containing protein [Gallionellaceae bacterium]
MNDRRILDSLQKSARENLEYFSTQNKEVRERWVVSEFLRIIEVQHYEGELISLEQKNKTDVQFRKANFQVKELTDPDLRRYKMYKDACNSANSANTLAEVSLTTEARDMPPVANMYELVFNKTVELARSKKYEETKRELDLLMRV